MGFITDPRSLHFFSGGTTHRAAATTYGIKAVDVVNGIEITLPLDALHDVRGRVETADGTLANSGGISLTDNSDPLLTYKTKYARMELSFCTRCRPGAIASM